MQNCSAAGRLLVLDDNVDVAMVVCMLAERAGYRSTYALRPKEFFEQLATVQPTHIVVDLRLGDEDGIEILRRLTEMKSSAAVIIMSGLGERVLASSARAAAEGGLFVAGTLSKPISRSDLLRVLDVRASADRLRHRDPSDDPVQDVTEADLEAALRSGEFRVLFQPKVSCADRKLVGVECLARWMRPGKPSVPPQIFIAMAERSGLINEITRVIHESAIRQTADMASRFNMKIALNISGMNLRENDYLEWLVERCRHFGMDTSRIILELTETASMDGNANGLEQLTKLRILGFHLSIDDFGIGYSSLRQLARLPFSELKIDQMFVKNLAESEESRKIVSAIVGLGKSLALNVVAEGVEDSWALDFLRDVGCNEAQGFFIAGPMDRDALAAWGGGPWTGAA